MSEEHCPRCKELIHDRALNRVLMKSKEDFITELRRDSEDLSKIIWMRDAIDEIEKLISFYKGKRARNDLEHGEALAAEQFEVIIDRYKEKK